MASKKVQMALLAGASALLAGAIVLWGLPSKDEAGAPSETMMQADIIPNPGAPLRDSTQGGERQALSPQQIAEALAADPANRTDTKEPAPIQDLQAASSAVTPIFDVVRIGPAGEAVIAGRVAPGKTVELLVNGKVYDRVQAHASGAFALTPPTLPPGDHQLTLREVGSGGVGTLSRQSVTVVLSADLASSPVVALTEPDKPTIVLAGPGLVTRQPADENLIEEGDEPLDAEELAADSSGADKTQLTVSSNLPQVVSIATVEAEAGRLYVSGTAPKEASVRLYLNDTFLAAGKASMRGTFSFTVNSGIDDGEYRVRLDEVAPADGKVLSRAEVPFVVQNAKLESSTAQQATVPSEATPDTQQLAETYGSAARSTVLSDDGSHVVVPEVRTTRVEHGDSLWSISRRAYGEGTRYTVIYGANQKQIRNPDLIYPGQLFVVPGNAEKPATD